MRMTMISFRTDEETALLAQRWSERLHVDRSELLREALRQHLLRLASGDDATTWERLPLDKGELSLSKVADWGVSEDSSDWADAAR